MTTLSAKCLWRSSSSTPDNCFSSSIEPTAIISPSSAIHTGKGVPQKRFLEIFQSLAFSNHLPNRPFFMCSGTQLTCWLESIIHCLRVLVTPWSLVSSASIFKNHVLRALYNNGTPVLQQCG